MEEQNHIDKALAFMESLERLHNQLKAAEEQQKLLLAHLLDLKKEGKTDSEEYAQTSQHSRARTCKTSSTSGAPSIWNAWRW